MIGAFQSLRASNRIGSRAHKHDPEKTGYGDNSYGDKSQDKSSFPAAGQNDCRQGGQFGRARRFDEGGDVAGRDGGRRSDPGRASRVFQ